MNQPVTTAPSEARARATTQTYPAWRRRQILLIPAFQLRATASVFALAVLLVTAVDATYYALQQTLTARTLAVAPELHEILRGQDRLEMGWILVGSLVFLVGVATVTLIESHRTAGPVYKLARTMERTTREGPVLRLKLRKDDHFRDLEPTFNGMVNAIQARSRNRAAQARRILEQIDQLAESSGQQGTSLAQLGTRLRVISSDLQKLEEELEG